MTTWEEDFAGDDSAEYREDGELIGGVMRIGGSWQVTYRGKIVAMRPDKRSAQSCLSKLHDEVNMRGGV
jgi:hypothetical protein